MATKTADETETVAAVDAGVPVTAGGHADFVPGEDGEKVVPRSTGKYGEPWPYHDDEYDGYTDAAGGEGNASPPNVIAAEQSVAAAEDVIGPFTGTVTKKTNDDDPHEKPARAQAGAKTKK